MKKFWWIFLIIVILTPAFAWVLLPDSKLEQNKKQDSKNNKARVTIGQKNIFAVIASTPDQIEKGLSGRKSLAKGEGMLFVFPEIDFHTFWMKDTKIPLDIIWILDNQIVEVATLQPETPDNIPIHAPENEAEYVLEVNAGLVKENNWQVGDEVEIDLK